MERADGRSPLDERVKRRNLVKATVGLAAGAAAAYILGPDQQRIAPLETTTPPTPLNSTPDATPVVFQATPDMRGTAVKQTIQAIGIPQNINIITATPTSLYPTREPTATIDATATENPLKGYIQPTLYLGTDNRPAFALMEKNLTLYQKYIDFGEQAANEDLFKMFDFSVNQLRSGDAFTVEYPDSYGMTSGFSGLIGRAVILDHENSKSAITLYTSYETKGYINELRIITVDPDQQKSYMVRYRDSLQDPAYLRTSDHFDPHAAEHWTDGTVLEYGPAMHFSTDPGIIHSVWNLLSQSSVNTEETAKAKQHMVDTYHAKGF